MGGVFTLEIKRNITRWSAAGLLIFILVASMVLQIGIAKYKLELKQEKEFIEVEARKVQRYINYMQYGGYGFRRLLKSSPLMAMFYNSTTLGDLQAFIDSGVRLNFSKPEIGKNLFERPTGGTLDFSWYILQLGSLIVMAWGFTCFRNREYLRYLMNFTSAGNVYWGILLGRILLIGAALAITMGIAFIQFLLNGITLTAREISSLSVFLLIAFITLVFLLMVSAGLGALENRPKGGVLTVVCWLLLVMLWPEILNVAFSNKAAANMKSRYKHEIQKIEKLMEFERLALAHARDTRYKTEEEKFQSDKTFGEQWIHDKFKDIEKIDGEMADKTGVNARNFQFWSIFNPVTFYKSVNNELSSKGYYTYNRFYRENQAIRKGFLRYYLNKRFYENYAKVEPFLSGEASLVHAGPGLPAYFGLGLGISLLYLVFSFYFSLFRFNARVYPRPGKVNAAPGFHLDLKPGKYININVHVREFIHQLLNVLNGKGEDFTGKVTIDGLNAGARKRNSVYLPAPGTLRGGIKAGSYIDITGRLMNLGNEEIRECKAGLGPGIIEKRLDDLDTSGKALVMFKLALLKGAGIFICHDFLKQVNGIAYTLIRDEINKLKSRGIIFVDLVSGHGNNMEPDVNASVRPGETGYEITVMGNDR